MAKDILRVENLERIFRVGSEDVHALRGISFTITEGEFVSIMGTSGSGKSTLLNILGCLDTPSAGDYIIDGVSIKSLSKNDLSTLRNRKIKLRDGQIIEDAPINTQSAAEALAAINLQKEE